MHKRSSDSEGTSLAVVLEELITRVPGKSMRSLARAWNSSEKYGVGGLQLQILCYEESSIHVEGKREDAGQAQREPPVGVGQGGLTSHLT